MESYKESLKQRKQQIVEEHRQLKENEEASKVTLEKHEIEKENAEKNLEKLNSEIKICKETLSRLSEKNRQLDKESSHLQIQIGQLNARKKMCIRDRLESIVFPGDMILYC